MLRNGTALGGQLPEATEEVLSTYSGVQVTFFEPPGVYTAFWGAPMTADSSPEDAASAWLTAHASAFGIDDPDLRLVRSQVVGTGGFTVFAYQQFINDLPVIPSMARILVLNGAEDRVVYAAARSMAVPPPGGFPEMQVEGPGALASAQNEPGYPELDEYAVPELVVLVPHGNNMAIRCWKVSGRSYAEAGAYTFYVDAATGGIIQVNSDVFDATGVTGNVKGHVSAGTLPFHPNDPQLELVPLAGLRVQLDSTNACEPVACNGEAATTEANGSFTIYTDETGPVAVHADLGRPYDYPCDPPSDTGPWVHVPDCSTGLENCPFPEPPLRPETPCHDDVSPDEPPLLLQAFVFNPQQSADDRTTAQVNCFYHTTLTHDFYRVRQPGFEEIDLAIPCYVNLTTATCAAQFLPPTGPMLFAAPGPHSQIPNVYCVNMAYSTVIAHEYGHFILYQPVEEGSFFMRHRGVSSAVADGLSAQRAW